VCVCVCVCVCVSVPRRGGEMEKGAGEAGVCEREREGRRVSGVY